MIAAAGQAPPADLAVMNEKPIQAHHIRHDHPH